MTGDRGPVSVFGLPKQARPSFLKKRSKKLLTPLSRTFPESARQRSQKFFGPFFQKRTACFLCVSNIRDRIGLAACHRRREMVEAAENPDRHGIAFEQRDAHNRCAFDLYPQVAAAPLDGEVHASPAIREDRVECQVVVTQRQAREAENRNLPDAAQGGDVDAAIDGRISGSWFEFRSSRSPLSRETRIQSCLSEASSFSSRR